jgi:CRP-like cAMP-binding protein
LPPGRPAADIAALLRTHPLFADIDVEALTRLIGCGRMLALCPGDVLIQHGETSDAAYIVVEGCATVRLDTSYGAVSLSTVSAPALVGEIGVFMGVPRTATIEAAAALCAVRIGSTDLRQFGSENPGFLAAVMTQVGRRFQAFNNAIGFYSNALTALRQDDFDLRLLDELKTPPAELIDERHLALTIGDVSGKGVPAALYMAAAQTALRLALRQHGKLDAGIAAANDLLVANNREAMFASLFCAVIDVGNGDLAACNCGQPAPFILRRNGGCDRIPSSNPPLGVQPATQFKTSRMPMEEGDLIFLTTDGLPDARDAAGKPYGEARLDHLVRDLGATRAKESAKDFVLAVLAAVTQFARQAPRFDDLTAVALIYGGFAADRTSR